MSTEPAVLTVAARSRSVALAAGVRRAELYGNRNVRSGIAFSTGGVSVTVRVVHVLSRTSHLLDWIGSPAGVVPVRVSSCRPPETQAVAGIVITAWKSPAASVVPLATTTSTE